MEWLWDNKESLGNKTFWGKIKFVIEVIRDIFRGGKWDSEMMDMSPKPTSPKPSSPSEYVIPEQDWRF